MQRKELERYLHDYLQVDKYSDYCPNGLQVAGRDEIRKIVTGVSACAALFEKALEQKADAIIVHHGLIWKNVQPTYRGGYKKRIKLLLENDISLFGFHLPLDAHPEIGNNAQLARLFALQDVVEFCEYNGQPIGFKGTVPGLSCETFFGISKEKINPQARIFPFGPEQISSVGIVSGGASKEAVQAVAEELDVYLTGEAAEYSMHYAREEGFHYIAAGHHATERFGIRALGEHLQEKFPLEVRFIDIPNPV